MKSLILISIIALCITSLNASTPDVPFFTPPMQANPEGFRIYTVKESDTWKSIFMEQYGIEPENSALFVAAVNALIMEAHHNIENKPASQQLEKGSKLFLVPLMLIDSERLKRIYQPIETK